MKKMIKNALKRDDNGTKINTVLATQYKKVDSNGEETTETKTFNTKNAAIFQTTNLDDWYIQNVRESILKEMEEFQERDSGWTLHSITSLTVNMNRHNPMRGSSYIDLPTAIKRKQACVNVQNFDNQCFQWAILSALHPVTKNHNRVVKYKQYADELDFKGIEFPVLPKDISIFEKQNNISVNVYMLPQKDEFYSRLTDSGISEEDWLPRDNWLSHSHVALLNT